MIINFFFSKQKLLICGVFGITDQDTIWLQQGLQKEMQFSFMPSLND